MKIEYQEFEDGDTTIKEIEVEEMKSNILPLNINNNKRPELKEFNEHLSSKRRGIEKLEFE
ncbi:MAG: hypothetical protein LBC39_07645 [Methanobrevibacter sp.]|jgi:hypothetical protein|nr:hypothetical protein [Candidatus Methanovirga aequatorialis]